MALQHYFWLGLLLAAATGFRGYFVLFGLGLAARCLHFGLNEHVAWLATPTAIGAFGCAGLVEFLVDKFPLLDNVMDVIHTLIRPLAGIVAMTSIEAHPDTATIIILGLVGGGASLGVHALKAFTRATANASTLGTAAPGLSILEDILVVGGLIFGLKA